MRNWCSRRGPSSRAGGPNARGLPRHWRKPAQLPQRLGIVIVETCAWADLVHKREPWALVLLHAVHGSVELAV